MCQFTRLRKVSRSLGLVSAGVGGVILLAAVNAQATPVSYVIDPGTSTNLGGDVETITGSFTFDTATDLESNVSITLTGLSPFAGTYIDNSTDRSQLQADGLAADACGTTGGHGGGGNSLCLRFTNPLSGGPTDPLSFVGYVAAGFPNDPATDFGTSVVGSASPGVATTPLPAALPLFATGLGAMGLFGWRRKRKSAAAIAA